MMRAARGAVRLVVGVPALLVLGVVALSARRQTRARLRRGQLPRLVWGPVPIISIRDWSAALRGRGYESRTCVFDVYNINVREDFDRHYDEFLPAARGFDLVRAFAVFAWALRSADVFISFLDGGFLRGTALRSWECQLLRLAGKKLIVTPYGADIAVPSYLGVAEEPLLRDYPHIAEQGEVTRRRVLYFCNWADVVIRNYQYGFLPRWDFVWPTMIGIDIEAWRSERPPGLANGRNGPVTVVHAPNHRHIKGTDRLLEVVAELRAEGLDVRLDLLERRPNREVQAAVAAGDIVAEQFIAGYALFAIEGMSAGRPVLSALSWLPADIRELPVLRECPIVDTSLERLKDDLRRLLEDPALRRRLGAAGRDFACRRHSYDAVGLPWAAIIEHAWRGAPLPEELGRSGVLALKERPAPVFKAE